MKGDKWIDGVHCSHCRRPTLSVQKADEDEVSTSYKCVICKKVTRVPKPPGEINMTSLEDLPEVE